MPMTPEERKEYNKTYYENNKVKIIQKNFLAFDSNHYFGKMFF